MEKITKPRGTADVLPGESGRWRELEAKAARIAMSRGFNEIRFPTFEHTELFSRGVGDTTDIVTKEMYTFEDKGGRSITLRPEGTASAVRACIENGLFAGAMPLKLFYIAPMFRYEKPQSGRLREHHQFGAELFGAAGFEGDLEIISLARAFLSNAVHIPEDGVNLHINSIGCSECRPVYRARLIEYLADKPLCALCLERVGRNPLRVLDCKNDGCREFVKNAPSTADTLCGNCAAHFESLKKGLSQLGINYTVNDKIVRGLDYYNGPVFEFIRNGLTVLGGGRYDTLTGSLGGSPTTACGFGSGLERLLAVQDELGISFGGGTEPILYIAVAGDAESPAAVTARALTGALRDSDIFVDSDICGRSLKAQLKQADRMNARYMAIIGEDEVRSGQLKLRRMSDGAEFFCKIDTEKIYNIIQED